MKIARLRFRINITILFTIIGLSSIFGILRIQSELQRYASSRNRIQLLLDSIITLNRQGIVDILIKNNNMNDSLETIAEIENIYNVSLYDSKGKILFFSGEKLDDGASIRVSVLSEEDKKENFTDFISPLEQTTVIKDSVFIREQIHIVKYKTSLPLGSYLGAINLENRDIGYIRIFFNLSSIEEEIYYSIISFFILVMTILLIFLGIMNFLLVRYYEDSIEGNFHLSNNGKLVKANRSFLKMFGYRSIKNLNKRINKDFDKLFADPLEFIDVMSKIKNSNSTKFENNYRRKDKTNIWLFIEINKITDIQGQTSYFECSALDITERKEKEKAERDLLKNISETKEYLNNIFNSLPSMVISIDTDKNILQWNNTIVHTLEIPAKEVLGKKLSIIIPFFKEYEIKIEEAIDKSIKTDFKCDQEINHKTLILHITISPLCKNDIVQGAIISMDDITEEQKKD
ncbi:MAG: PAS domain S-box protein, partial [bacterium]|nr:PAS domain S-box protein [bacterium]